MKNLAIMAVTSILLTSCYSYNSVVGKGSVGTSKVSKWNHYAVAGLVPISVSDSRNMADGADDYTVNTKQSFLNGLISVLTCGIYSPTTTTVSK